MTVPAIADPSTGARLELRDGLQRLVVDEVGACLRSWTIGDRELLDTVAPDEPDEDFRGKVLMPWPNRLRDGCYVFDGVEHRTEITEPERATAIHGLTAERRWRVTRSSTRHLTLVHDLGPEPGYPFALRLAVRYELVTGGVAITLQATNAGAARAPFGAGLHPYLTLGEERIDDDLLELPARTWLPVDERLLPAGRPQSVQGTDVDFRRPRRIGGFVLDRCFGDLERDADGIANVRLIAPGGGRQVTVWMDAAFGYVQVYTADTVSDPSRRRGGLAIEPMTCAPDAFNSGDGLLVLEPGASFTGRCGLLASGYP